MPTCENSRLSLAIVLRLETYLTAECQTLMLIMGFTACCSRYLCLVIALLAGFSHIQFSYSETVKDLWASNYLVKDLMMLSEH